MSWEIVAGIIALFGFIITVGGVVGKLSAAIATLNTTLTVLESTIRELREKSHETHRVLFEKSAAHDKLISEHEGRLKNLEEKL